MSNIIMADKKGGSGTISITENGTYDVTEYAEAEVNVSGGGDTPVLPNEYTRLDYLTGDGLAWIDTEEYRQSGDVLEFIGGKSATANSYNHILGTSECFIQYGNQVYITAAATFRINDSGNHGSQGVSMMKAQIKITDTAVEQTDIDGFYTGVVSFSGTVNTDKISMALFARHKLDGTADYPANGYSIFRFKWHRNNSIIHDFVPALRKSDSILGFYDIVTNTFHTNASSTGAFSGGASD